MEFLSWTIAVILGISSIISPIATAIINNKFQLDKFKLEISHSKKREVLENFIQQALTFYGETLTFQQMKQYTASVHNLYLHFDNVDSSVFDILDTFREERNIKEYKNTIKSIVIELSKQIDKN